jgi:hypothetical protein
VFRADFCDPVQPQRTTNEIRQRFQSIMLGGLLVNDRHVACPIICAVAIWKRLGPLIATDATPLAPASRTVYALQTAQFQVTGASAQSVVTCLVPNVPRPIADTPSKAVGMRKREKTEPNVGIRAANADVFFERLVQLLDTEANLVTNAETDLDMRARMRRAIKPVKQMLVSAQRFHSYRFSDDPERLDCAAVEARRLIDVLDRCSRHAPGLEFVKALSRIDDRTSFQPMVFGRQFASVARASLGVIRFHYVRFDDAFEESASTDTWTKKAFNALCHRLDRMTSLSFNTPMQSLVPSDVHSLAETGRTTARRRRGRPTATDADEQQILRLWKTGDFKSYKECADAVVSPQESKIPLWKRVQRIVVRYNKRQSRSRNANGKRA